MTYTDLGTPPPEQEPTPGWGQSLSSGAAGLALLHISYAHAGIGDWSTAHQWVKAMTRSPVTAHPDACLYQGAPAVAFVLRTAGLPVYARVLAGLDQHIAEVTRTRLARANDRIDRVELPELREFDLINGLTGLGVYLLQAVPGDLLHRYTDLLREVLAYLVRLTETITVDSAKLPGWWTANGPSDRPEPRWPGGHADDSFCHGWAGLVHTTRRAAADTEPNGELALTLRSLESRWRRRRKQARPQLSDPGGMLEGGAGVALTDLAGPPAAGWDACLLTTVPTSLPTVTTTHTEGLG